MKQRKLTDISETTKQTDINETIKETDIIETKNRQISMIQ